MIRRLLSPLRALNTLRYYFMLECLRLMPWGFVVWWLKLQARAKYYLYPGLRRQAQAWLRETVPADRLASDGDRLVREMFTFATFDAYLGYLLLSRDARDHQELLAVQGWDRVQEALGQNRGVVLLTSHVGLPCAERWFLRTQDRRVRYLYRIGHAAERDTSWHATWRRWLNNRYRVISDEFLGNEDLSVQYMKKAYDHLRQNGIVNVTGTGPHGTGRRHLVTICGHRYLLAHGGISLGLLSGAAVVPCFTFVDEGARFHVEFQEPLSSVSDDRPARTETLVEAYAARIERFITSHPTNVPYFAGWMARRAR